MTRWAYKTLYPLDADGVPQAGRRIDPGDRLEIGLQRNGLYPVTYPVRLGTRSAWLRDLGGTAAVYNQNDYPLTLYPAPGYETATVRSGGCGPTSAAIVAGTLRPGCGLDPVRMASYARSVGARVSGGTDMAVLLKRLGERLGLSVGATSSLAELRLHLLQGGIAVANVAGVKDVFSNGGHYIAALGEDRGRLMIADPGYYAGKYGALRYPQRAKLVSVLGTGSKVILSAAPETLDMDCVGRSPRYYLVKG